MDTLQITFAMVLFMRYREPQGLLKAPSFHCLMIGRKLLQSFILPKQAVRVSVLEITAQFVIDLTGMNAYRRSTHVIWKGKMERGEPLNRSKSEADQTKKVFKNSQLN